MHAVIFDIDGTLLDSFEDDAVLYVEAIPQVLGQVTSGRPGVPGALKFVRDLTQRPDVQIAYATGGWRAAAALKLGSAGFPMADIPLSSACDHEDRQHIMLHALSQLRGPFASITYFGDGIWDQQATRALGWRFVAVGPKLGGLSGFSALTLEAGRAMPWLEDERAERSPC